ncbi:MAG: cysteine synthase A [Actinobacteria bacterium HGW-Actinobacteria-1]|jgi:cysteine synthase A|nr:MAG: cysteine synthase A [Actinobacteria bacterium HGW-Actinobacteria-1]
MDAHTSIIETIGRTPAVRLNHIAAGLGAEVVIKLESRNPGGSVKDRIAWGMIADAEERGVISPGDSVIVEPTSGNTGIALAMIGAARGYRVILTMPESFSVERRKLLAAYGAELVLTPRETGMQGAVDAANELAATIPGAFLPGQFSNPANPASHYRTTGPEVESLLAERRLGAFVAGVGTGGTITGTGRYLKERHPDVRLIAVEPAESAIIGQRLRGESITPGPHLIQGIGANFIPDVLDLALLDEALPIPGETAIAMARRLAAEEGIFVGISSGANVAAALQVAARPEMAGTSIVTVAPSTGERYLSTPLWEGIA